MLDFICQKVAEINCQKLMESTCRLHRSYYAIFHAMRSVLALENKDFSKHSGVSAYFRKEYIKTEIFSIELSDIISSAFDVRSNSDYDDFYMISKEEVEEQITNAVRFCDEVKGFLDRQLEINKEQTP